MAYNRSMYGRSSKKNLSGKKLKPIPKAELDKRKSEALGLASIYGVYSGGAGAFAGKAALNHLRGKNPGEGKPWAFTTDGDPVYKKGKFTHLGAPNKFKPRHIGGKSPISAKDFNAIIDKTDDVLKKTKDGRWVRRGRLSRGAKRVQRFSNLYGSRLKTMPGGVRLLGVASAGLGAAALYNANRYRKLRNYPYEGEEMTYTRNRLFSSLAEAERSEDPVAKTKKARNKAALAAGGAVGARYASKFGGAVGREMQSGIETAAKTVGKTVRDLPDEFRFTHKVGRALGKAGKYGAAASGIAALGAGGYALKKHLDARKRSKLKEAIIESVFLEAEEEKKGRKRISKFNTAMAVGGIGGAATAVGGATRHRRLVRRIHNAYNSMDRAREATSAFNNQHFLPPYSITHRRLGPVLRRAVKAAHKNRMAAKVGVGVAGASLLGYGGKKAIEYGKRAGGYVGRKSRNLYQKHLDAVARSAQARDS